MSFRHVFGPALIAISLPLCALAQAATVARPAPVNTTAINPATVTIKPLPPRAVAMNARLSPQLTPSAHGWVQSEARVIAGRNLSPDAMVATAQRDVTSRFAGQKMASGDVESMVLLVMMQVANDAQNELRSELQQMQAANEKKKAMRDAQNAQKQAQNAMKDSLKDHKDALSDMSSEQQMKMQMVMDRMTKAEQALSNIEKKMSETSSSIIGNLK